MRKCRIGVVGIGRGSMMWNYCKDADNAELVAICDKWEQGLENVKKELGTGGISYYTDYDEFLKHDMDAVMLANYATEHAPFAIKAMEAGKSVISEVLPCQTMAEAVALIECTVRTGKTYCYAENYCFMGAPREIRKKYKEGKGNKKESFKAVLPVFQEDGGYMLFRRGANSNGDIAPLCGAGDKDRLPRAGVLFTAARRAVWADNKDIQIPHDVRERRKPHRQKRL